MRSCIAKVELTCQQSGERLLDALASIHLLSLGTTLGTRNCTQTQANAEIATRIADSEEQRRASD
jgi:hypothetical protein